MAHQDSQHRAKGKEPPQLSQIYDVYTMSSRSPTAALATPPKSLGKYSASIPFLRRPKFLTGRFAGDVGFDPFGFASSPEQLVYYREAEVKHARIAMLVSCSFYHTFLLPTYGYVAISEETLQ